MCGRLGSCTELESVRRVVQKSGNFCYVALRDQIELYVLENQIEKLSLSPITNQFRTRVFWREQQHDANQFFIFLSFVIFQKVEKWTPSAKRKILAGTK